MASPASTHPDRAAELARLIEDQRLDDARRYSTGGPTVANESCFAAGIGVGYLDTLPDPKAPDPAELVAAAELVELVDPAALALARRRAASLLGPKVIGLGLIWTAGTVAYDGKAPCPAHDGPPPRGSSCAICSASAAEPRRHPMAGTPTRVRRPAKRTRARASARGQGRKAAAGPELAGGIGCVARPLAV